MTLRRERVSQFATGTIPESRRQFGPVALMRDRADRGVIVDQTGVETLLIKHLIHDADLFLLGFHNLLAELLNLGIGDRRVFADQDGA